MRKPATDVLGAGRGDISCAAQDQCGPPGARCSLGARPDVPVRSPGPGAPGGRGADWKGRLVLSDPALVGEEAPDRVVLVVAQTTGCQFDVSCGHGWHPDGVVGELAVDRGPEGCCFAGVIEFEHGGFLHLAVECRAAVVAVAGSAAAGEEL